MPLTQLPDPQGCVTNFVKRNEKAPSGFFACEAAGLQWLSDAQGGVPCAQIVSVDTTSLTLRRLDSLTPSPEAAYEFGGRLAATHDAGAPAFGAGPDGWDGPAFFGPLSQPLPMSLRQHQRWGDFYADERLAPMAELAAPRLDASTRAAIDAVAARCRTGNFDDDDHPARLHGDLWGGNVMWTPDGVVLIDPAAHGGHRESDLAMLALFGCPHYEDVLAGYQRARPLERGWRARIGLHQLFPLLAHVVLFGGGHARRTSVVARAVLDA
jgi:fructosamine-3-kinase